jgi:hypothetical protein
MTPTVTKTYSKTHLLHTQYMSDTLASAIVQSSTTPPVLEQAKLLELLRSEGRGRLTNAIYIDPLAEFYTVNKDVTVVAENNTPVDLDTWIKEMEFGLERLKSMRRTIPLVEYFTAHVDGFVNCWRLQRGLCKGNCFACVGVGEAIVEDRVEWVALYVVLAAHHEYQSRVRANRADAEAEPAIPQHRKYVITKTQFEAYRTLIQGSHLNHNFFIDYTDLAPYGVGTIFMGNYMRWRVTDIGEGKIGYSSVATSSKATNRMSLSEFEGSLLKGVYKLTTPVPYARLEA